MAMSEWGKQAAAKFYPDGFAALIRLLRHKIHITTGQARWMVFQVQFLRRRIRQLEREQDAARQALRPFAEFFDGYFGLIADGIEQMPEPSREMMVFRRNYEVWRVTFADLKRAKEAHVISGAGDKEALVEKA